MCTVAAYELRAMVLPMTDGQFALWATTNQKRSQSVSIGITTDIRDGEVKPLVTFPQYTAMNPAC